MTTPKLPTRAAQFFLLAEQVSRLQSLPNKLLWEQSPRNPTDCLPALVAAVRKLSKHDILEKLARFPLPSRLSPESIPWHESLVAAWELHRESDTARLALARLDGCSPPAGMQRPSRLPEYLEEVRKVASDKWREEENSDLPVSYERLKALGALAAWRPAPDVITAPETLQDWVDFWQERRRSGGPILKGIAAKALLNLPEADLRAASIRPYGRVPNPPLLLHELATAIPAAAKESRGSDYYEYFFHYLPMLDWQPASGMSLPVEGLVEVARAWLDITRHGQWHFYHIAWQQLIRWERAGSLTACGIDLLPHLVPVVKNEKYDYLLSTVSHWMPTAPKLSEAGTGSDFALLPELEAGWQHHRQSGSWLKREYGWLGSIRLHQAGVASEPPARFMKAYLSAVAEESDEDVLSVLAQWAPGPDAPPDVHREWRQSWQRRLGDGDESIRQVAGFALLRQAMEGGTGQAPRHAALEMWRTGTNEVTGTYRQPGDIVSRFHEVCAQLATGTVPDFEAAPTPPAQRQYPRLALPSGYIAGREWKMENGELKMENDGPELKPGNRPAPDGPSR